MRNQYVADVGDFGKLGLLRALAGVAGSGDGPRLSVGVVWYRPSVETGPRGDGTKRGYLDSSRRQRYEECDPELFGHLKEISDTNRNLNALGDRGLLGGEPEDFYNCAIEVPKRHWSRDKRRDMRADWWRQALECVGDKQIVFVDPDNGLAPRSVPITRKAATKYAYLHEEIASLLSLDSVPVIVIYHHLGRSFEGRPATHPEQMRMWATKLKDELGLGEEPEILWYRRGTARAYFVLLESDDHGVAVIRKRLEAFRASPWFEHKHFTLVPQRHQLDKAASPQAP